MFSRLNSPNKEVLPNKLSKQYDKNACIYGAKPQHVFAPLPDQEIRNGSSRAEAGLDIWYLISGMYVFAHTQTPNPASMGQR